MPKLNNVYGFQNLVEFDDVAVRKKYITDGVYMSPGTWYFFLIIDLVGWSCFFPGGGRRVIDDFAAT